MSLGGPDSQEVFGNAWPQIDPQHITALLHLCT
jgi:hypothetical protein